MLMTLVGCASSNAPTVYVPGPGRSVANLALGPSRDHAILAEMYAYRSSWPSVPAGYVFDDVSTYTEVNYDDQTFYDWREGGGYTREAISVRTGVLIR
ncbi:MAG: hypothetical protein ACE5I3_07725 [Phycisphaerae bacterium]